ncbi:MAG: hypothetical protein HYV18_07710 [Gammaproteobacteria bacterium]|nr:hypothetical protein [Gammaproteobacteria bacterium]
MKLHSNSLAGLVLPLLLAAPSAIAAPGDPYCSLPGLLVADDAAGDGDSPAPGHDVLQAWIAEPPQADGVERIFFTLKVDRLEQAATPQSRYYVNFALSDGVARWVRYTPYPLGPASAVFTGADQMWSYGHTEQTATGSSSVTDGPADPASTASADGTITFVLPKEALPIDSETGEALINVVGEARIYNVSGTVAVDASDTPGVYELHGSASCTGGGKGLLGVGAMPLATLLLLALPGLARRRR